MSDAGRAKVIQLAKCLVRGYSAWSKKVSDSLLRHNPVPYVRQTREYQLEIVYRVADHLGVKLNKNSNPEASYNVAWNGKALNVKGTDPRDILHHLAHWIIASEKQRKLDEFGLGSGFDTGNNERAEKARAGFAADFFEAEDQEHQASLLGILMERHLKLDTHYSTLKDHSWDISCDLDRNRVYTGRDNTMLAALSKLLFAGEVSPTGRVKALKSLKI